jgi:hypothetical protein
VSLWPEVQIQLISHVFLTAWCRLGNHDNKESCVLHNQLLAAFFALPCQTVQDHQCVVPEKKQVAKFFHDPFTISSLPQITVKTGEKHSTSEWNCFLISWNFSTFSDTEKHANWFEAMCTKDWQVHLIQAGPSSKLNTIGNKEMILQRLLLLLVLSLHFDSHSFMPNFKIPNPVFHGLTAIIPTQLITDRKEGGKARV